MDSKTFMTKLLSEYAKAKFAAGLIFKMLGYKPEIDNMSKAGRKLVNKLVASFDSTIF